jgi:hypothetical protein
MRRARLEGGSSDLDHLVDLLPTGDVTVEREGNRYYLAAAQIDTPSPPNTPHEVAERLLVHVNGLGRMTHPDFRPVSLNSIFDDETGRDDFSVALTMDVQPRVRVTATVVNGEVIVGPPRGPRYVSTALNNPEVAEALELMSHQESPRWADLVKVWEIIREAIRRDNETVVGLGWTTKSVVDSFCESANHPLISGEDARHARRPDQPKHPSMTLAGGQQFIRELLKLAGATREQSLARHSRAATITRAYSARRQYCTH